MRVLEKLMGKVGNNWQTLVEDTNAYRKFDAFEYRFG